MKMKTQALALSALCMAMVGCGGSSSSDNGGEADIRFPFDGEITLSGDTDPGATLTAVVTDANGISGSISYVWTSGDTVITSATGSTYVIADSDQGKSISVTATYTDDDNFDESVFTSVSIEAAPTPATFDGLAATIGNDATEALTGTVTVDDPNTGEETIVALTDATTTYGTFSISAEGSWSYTLDTTAEAVANLTSADDPLLDSVEIESADGTTANLVITITGGEVAAPTTTKAAKITDTLDSDAGELRYKFDSSDIIEQGKMTVSFLKENTVAEGTTDVKDAYIALYGTSTKTDDALVDLRIKNGTFEIRNQDGIDIDVPFTVGEWNDVEITWDASGDAAPLVTITINGTSVTQAAFASAASDLATVAGGVRTVVFKLSDTGSIIGGDEGYYVDNIKVYSDLAGTTIAFEDNFESYDEGTSLKMAPYDTGATVDAVVAVIEGPASGDGSGDGSGGGATSGPGIAGNQYAKITDNMTDDAGELRYKFATDDIIAAGKLTVSFLKEDTVADGTTTVKDAYIALYGTSTKTDDALVDLRIKDGTFEIRNQDGIDIAIPFEIGTWHDVEITWDASGDGLPLVTITIDGVSVTAEAFASASTDAAAVAGGVQVVAFKLGDTSSVIANNASYNVDDVKVYSDLAGTTIAFEDNFESYTSGVSLDASPYDGSTAEAFVATE